MVIGMLLSSDQIDSALKYIDLTLKEKYMLSMNSSVDCVQRCIRNGSLDKLVSIIERCKVASHETYGTLGGIISSMTGNQQVGFLGNRHVAVDLDYPSQNSEDVPSIVSKSLSSGVFRYWATSFVTNDLWYDASSRTNPNPDSEKSITIGRSLDLQA